jgi:hypothetical protein
MAKDKKALSKNDRNLSAAISDHNALMESDADEQWTPARGYQKTND